MPLQGDQRALLQLLCERGQSYEDIAGLLEIPAAEVRTQAREALTEIGGSDPDEEVGLTDFLLGQADPIGRADAVRYLQRDPATLELANRIQVGLEEVAPAAKQPNLPESRGKRRRAALPDRSDATQPAAPRAERDVGSSPRDRTRAIAAIAAIALIGVFAILAILGVFSGGDEPTESISTSTSADASTATTADASNITEVPLTPTADSGVAGRAIFGVVSNQELYVDVDVQGLDPKLPTGQAYILWLMVGDNAGYPIDRLEADENGTFANRLTVPTPIAVTIGNQASSVRVSSTSVSALQTQIDRATKQEVPILQFVGTELATGDIPLVQGGNGNGGGG